MPGENQTAGKCQGTPLGTQAPVGAEVKDEKQKIQRQEGASQRDQIEFGGSYTESKKHS